MKKIIWILEDEKLDADLYHSIFNKKYSIKIFSNLKTFSEALTTLKPEQVPALLVADLKLGLEEDFSQFISQEKNRALLSMPFIVMSSIDDPKVINFCINAGATDYLVKPFNKNELLFKVKKAMTDVPSLPNFSEFGDDLKYTLRERVIIEEFLKSPSRKLTREQIVDRVWPSVKVEYKTLDVHLCNLRKKLHTVGLTIASIGVKEWVLRKWDGVEIDNPASEADALVESIDTRAHEIPLVPQNTIHEGKSAWLSL